ncbi:MAG: hypothetical protein V5A87_05985 [Candidatus Bipolaricaulota bacterium]|nr:hypothetical protein [Candidatus Bipolaricaulota bacterium]MBS3792331.1 hypothetical protein [Candidatus Bipolaricaulota bacterium]
MKYEIKPKNFTFNFDLSLEKERVSRYLKTGGQSGIEKYVDRGLELGNQLVKSKATYSIGENNQNLVDKYHLPEPLHKAEYLAFGISTIGIALEEKVDELMKKGDYALSNILDSVGSAAVNETADRLGKKVLRYSRDNDLNNTRAFSPGSGSSHWKIKHQRFIFDSLNPSEIGVSLTSSFTMVPKKSSSFVIGLGQEVQQANDLYSCEGCKRADCPYRYTPTKAAV